MSIAYSEDRFLGGRVILRQPVAGFRAGLDAVMLAACIPAKDGDEILELGSGAGTASLCLAARVSGCNITGIEIDPALVELANENAAANKMENRVRFAQGDALERNWVIRDRVSPMLRQAQHEGLAQPLTLSLSKGEDTSKRDFAHVFANPPFHEGERSPDEARALALQDEGRLGDWLRAGLKRTRSDGTFTAILRADRLGEALNALPHRGTQVIPLWPRAGEHAKRVIVRVAKGARAPLAFRHGLVLHDKDGRYTPEAEAILRDGAALACP